MIALQLLAAVAVTSAAPVATSVSAEEIIAGAEHALQVNRLEQASVMASRAAAAGASGPKMERLLADLDFAKGKYSTALPRYEALLRDRAVDSSLLEHAGVAALKLGQVELAAAYLTRATSSSHPTWRSWNALGVLSDMKSDWPKAEDCYAEAMRLAPKEFEPINNEGWSLVLRGNWAAAIPLFEKAVALQPKSERARDNLDLATAAIAPQLPQRRPRESDESWAARLNDAGLAAAATGDKARATAAFTQALEVSGTWYARAANNMKAFANR